MTKKFVVTPESRRRLQKQFDQHFAKVFSFDRVSIEREIWVQEQFALMRGSGLKQARAVRRALENSEFLRQCYPG